MDGSMDDLKAAAKAMGVSIEAVPGGPPGGVGALLASGRWVYQDIPWMPAPVFDGLVSAAGEGNVHVLASSRRGSDARGQILLSDEGRAGIAAKAEELAGLCERLGKGNVVRPPVGAPPA